MNKRWWTWLGALAMLALVVLPVLAGIDMEGANTATITPGTITIATADSSDPIGTAPIRGLKVLGNPTLYMSLLYTSQASASVVVRADAYGPDGDDVDTDPDWMGKVYEGTLTTSSSSSGGRYFTTASGTVQATICAGATIVDVRVTSLTTGSTAYLKRWVGVANTRGPATE